MEFSNKIKGVVTQSLVKVLLEDAGYRVVPLGIEEVVREVITLDENSYHELGLPKPLRTLPDFLVSSRDLKQSWLLEVKYRKRWDQQTINSLLDSLRDQAKTWENYLLLVFLGEYCGDIDTPANYCRIFHLLYENDYLTYKSGLDGISYPWTSAEFKYGHKLSQIFLDLDDRIEDKTIKKCCEFAEKYPEILDA